jgi:uncharacterized membrane protein YdjX (TVP38/TMEM64 family)
MEAEQKRENRLRWFWGICLVILWGCAIALFVRANGHLSVQELLRYQPENKVLAAFAMWGLFLLKSVDFVIYSGLLYAIDGILFPLPAALFVNLVGIVIISTVPYFVGKSLGSPILKRIEAKYPKFQEVEKKSGDNVFLLALLLRCVGLPYNLVGMYMGARKCRFLPYLLGSVLGLIPRMIPYTLMGSSAADSRSPVFLGAIAAELTLIAFALLLYRYKIKSTRVSDGSPAPGPEQQDYTDAEDLSGSC